jgi:KAP family P-loop domain protein (fragment)
MCKIKQYLNKEKLSNARNWANEHGVVGYLVACLAVIYALVAYKSVFMDWYGGYVIPVLERFIPNFWSTLLAFVLVFFAIFDLVKKCRIRYQYDNKVIIALCVVAYLLVNCRLSGDYYYVHWLWLVAYVDVIWVLCIAYFLVAFINKCRKYFKSDNIKNESDKNAVDYNKLILNDWPIECKDDDIFDLDEEASKLANAIGSLDKNKTWSLAITAPWGAGKTSFLNLLLKHISKKDFEVVYFVPRDSKSVETIQEDFFSSIACVLSKYDHRCSHTMKDYMASLQLIDNRGVVEKLVNFYRIWNKVSLKETIKQTFSSLKKKVLVLIDDFDRLSKDEILEVLKLIDSNAAFTNLVFLTAYDKQQVNKSLGDTSNTADACFVDRFFNLEFSIPSRPYSYISRYIEDKLCDHLNASEEEKRVIQQTINKRNSTFKEYIPTLRDTKRYINQFVLDFMEVRGDVLIDEFLLIQLVKYRYPEQYKGIYGMKFFRGVSWKDGEQLFLVENLNPKPKILPVLSILFPDEKGPSPGDVFEEKVVKDLPYHIYNVNGFDNYFVNKIYSALRIRDMEQLLSLEWVEAIDTIDEWILDANKLKDFENYIYFYDTDKIKDRKSYMVYSDIVACLACKFPNTRAYELFIKTITIQNLEEYDNRFRLDFNAYKDSLLDIIKSYDDKLRLVGKLHYNYKNKSNSEDEILIKDADIWPYMQEKFIQATKDTNSDGVWLRGRLYGCIDYIEEISQHVHLDPECLKAYRKCIEKKPDLYISNFVFLGATSSHPDFNSVACEPFWRQIFGDETQFESYLKSCYAKKIAKSDLAWNFWQLYKANDFKPISYDNQGPVQEKIDNNLVDEIKKLESMQYVKEEISKVPDDMNSLSADEKTEYKQILLRCKEELKDIKLYISLNGTLNRLIDEKLEKYQ